MSISRVIPYAVAAFAVATGALIYAQTTTQPSIILTWDHPAPETVDHYWIERSLRVDFRDADTLGPVEATTYTDHPTTAGRTYYRVRAEGLGGTSAPSEYAQIVVTLPPVAPVDLNVSLEVAR